MNSSGTSFSIYKPRQYHYTEVIFFVVYFFVFPVLVDFEFGYNERHNATLFIQSIPSRLIWGLLDLPPYVFYYHFIAHNLLMKKQYAWYMAALIGFIIGLDLYTVYIKYWLVSQIAALPKEVVHSAITGYKAKVLLHFSVIYVFRDLLVITALSYYVKSARQEQQVSFLRQQQTQSELNSLKLQLHPHFFFNTLNSIYALALEKSDQTAPLISMHAEMMRYIIYQSSKPKVALSQEVKFLSDYINVESIRYQNHVDIKLDTQVTEASVFIEPLLLLPFIENSFKHGAQEETGCGFIHILICLLGSDLVLEVQNSKPIAYRPVAGIGLANVRQRLSLLYEGKHSLNIIETEKDYQVKLTITLL